MENDSKKCPNCGSTNVHRISKKLIRNKKWFITFNLVWFSVLIFLYCINGRTEGLVHAIIGSVIGEFVAIWLLYIRKKDSYCCDDCKTEFK